MRRIALVALLMAAACASAPPPEAPPTSPVPQVRAEEVIPPFTTDIRP